MILQKKSGYIPDQGQMLDSTRHTKSRGYMSAKDRIDAIIQAGQRLVDYRQGQYDFEDGEVPEDYDGELPRVRQPNFDAVDGQQDMQDALNRIHQRNDARRKKYEEKMAKSAQADVAKNPQGDVKTPENEPDNI